MNEEENNQDVREDPLQHLDFEIEPTCEIRWTRLGGLDLQPEKAPACGGAAQWLLVCRKCGTTAYCCNGHKLKMQLDTVNRRSLCGSVGPLSMVFRFIPVGRA